MQAARRHEVEERIRDISTELRLWDPKGLTPDSAARQHELQEVEELYAERERLLQELEQDC